MSLFVSATDYLYFAAQLFSGHRTRSELQAGELREKDVNPYCQQISSVLDVGSGLLAPQAFILAKTGCFVVGIDRAYGERSYKNLAYRAAQTIFRTHLGSSVGVPAFVSGDVSRLPFADGSFDLVTSIAAFEHFLDVPKVLEELQRVLRPRGIVWVMIHLFSSLSGGHNVGRRLHTVRHLPHGIEAWDHLRKRKLPFTVPLNEWRRNDYLNAFAERFEIVAHYAHQTEGLHHLTPEILASLKDFDQEELTCGSYVICARRRQS